MRKYGAIATLLLWGLCVELLPGLHVAAHALLPHHHHDGDHRRHEHEHEHEDEHEDEHGGDRENPLEHGKRSLAHRHLAVLGPPPPPVVIAVTVVGQVETIEPPTSAPPARRTAPVRQRGPPRAVSGS